MGTDIDAGGSNLSTGKSDLDEFVDLVVFKILNAMHKCLIQIEHDCFLNPTLFERRKVYLLAENLLVLWGLQVELHILQRLKCLDQMHFMCV
jgi:hypothetical protein